MTRERGCAGVIAGYLVGSVAGAVLALLLAPRPGSETRRGLRQRSLAWRGHVEGTGEGAVAVPQRLRQTLQALTARPRRRFWEGVREGREAAARKRAELLALVEHPSTPRG